MLPLKEKKWYKQFWPWFLIGLPILVVVACFYTVYLAVNHPLSMVEKDYYQEGLAINKNIAGLKKAKQLGLLARIYLGDNRQLRVELSAEEKHDEQLSLVLLFHHPVDDTRDLSFSLHKQLDKTYVTAPMTEQQWQSLTDMGRWYVRLQSSSADWVLQGEGSDNHFKNITLDARGG